MRRMSDVTLDDVAREAGVSKAAASFVMNNRPGVGEATRDRVLQVAAEMGYQKTLRRKDDIASQKHIRLLAMDSEEFPADTNISNTFFAQTIRGIENVCRRNDCMLVVSTISMIELQNRAPVTSDQNTNIGTVLLGTNLSEAEMLRVHEMYGPLVVLDNAAETTNLNTVSINNYQGASNAAKYLMEKRHGPIGYIMSESRLENFCERHRGFMGAVKQFGLDPAEIRSYQVSQGIQNAQRDFSAILSSGEALPKAFFCESDYIAIGVMRAFLDHGYAIPKDVQVIGFDDVPEASIIQPELTTIRVDKERMGETVAARLFQMLQKPSDNAMKIRLDTSLVIRDSV